MAVHLAIRQYTSALDISLFNWRASEASGHSLGVLNVNLLYIYMCVCMEVRMSQLSVGRAPHYVKVAELGHSHCLGRQHMESGRSLVSRIRYGIKCCEKGSVRFGYCLAFCLLTTALLQ